MLRSLTLRFRGRGERLEGPALQSFMQHAANDSFSNWVFGSSSFSLFLLGHCHSSGSRFSSQSVWCSDGTAARICRIGSGEPCLETRFKLRSSHLRLHPRTSSGEGRPRQGWAFRSCRALHIFLTEFCTIRPHPVEQDGEFASDRDNSATTTFGAHQPHAP